MVNIFVKKKKNWAWVLKKLTGNVFLIMYFSIKILHMFQYTATHVPYTIEDLFIIHYTVKQIRTI